MPKNQFSNANRQKLISYSCSTLRKTCNSKKKSLFHLDVLLLDLYQKLNQNFAHNIYHSESVTGMQQRINPS